MLMKHLKNIRRGMVMKYFDELGFFLVGILTGMLFMIFLLIVASDVYKPALNALIQCEQDLPRNQTCKITAVVDDEIQR